MVATLFNLGRISYIPEESLDKQATNLNIVHCRLELTKQRIRFSGPSEYNKLPNNLKKNSVLSTFKAKLKNYLLNNLEKWSLEYSKYSLWSIVNISCLYVK